MTSPIVLIPQNNSTYYFNNITTSNGLSQNSVSHIIQDNEGMVWMATQVGIDKYVGKEVFHANIFNKDLIEGVSLLYEWDEDHILICTSLKNYLVHKWKLHKVTELANSIVNILYISRIDNESFLVFTEDFIFLSDAELGKIKEVQIQSPIKQVVQKDTNRWFMGSEKGLLSYDLANRNEFDNTRPKWLVDDLPIDALLFNRDSSSLLLGGDTTLVLEYDMVGKQIAQTMYNIYPKDNDQAQSKVTSLYLDKDSILWVGTASSGLYFINLKTPGEIACAHSHCFRHRANLPSDDINTIFASKGDVIWVGTEMGGVSLWQKEKPLLKHHFTGAFITPDQVDNAEEKHHITFYKNAVWSILPQKKNQLILGTDKKGLAVLNLEDDKVEKWVGPDNNKEKSKKVFCLNKGDNDTIIIGTESGLFQWEPDADRSYYTSVNKILKDSTISVLEYSPEKRTWLVGSKKSNTIHLFDQKFNPLKTKNLQLSKKNEKLSFLQKINTSKDTFILIGTNKALYRFAEPALGLQEIYQNSTNIHFTSAFKVPDADSIWVGTDRNGLYSFDLSQMDDITYQAMNYGLEDDIEKEVIYSIHMDNFGSIWFSTNHGIFQYIPRFNVFNKYSQDNGIQVEEFNAGASAAAYDSILFFGGINGINLIKPLNTGINKESHFKPIIRFIIPAQDTFSLNFNKEIEGLKEYKFEYKIGYLKLTPLLGDYRDPENNQFQVFLNDKLKKADKTGKYIIPEKDFYSSIQFWNKNKLLIKYRVGDGDWLTLEEIKIVRIFFTGTNILIIPFGLVFLSLFLLVARYLKNFNKLQLVQNKINIISRRSHTKSICETAVSHFINDLKFDYAVISLIDFDKKIISSKYGDSKIKNITDPNKWMHLSTYPLDHADILAQVAKLGEEVVVINNSHISNNKIVRDKHLFHSEITSIYKHEKLARIFIPIIHRALEQEIKSQSDLKEEDLVIGVVEVGFSFNLKNRLRRLTEVKYLKRESDIRLQLYIDNFAQPYYKAYLKEEKKEIYRFIEQISKKSDENKEDHIGFLQHTLGELSKKIGVEYGNISLTSFNSEKLDFERDRITYGYQEKDVQDNILSYQELNKGKEGIINYVGRKKRSYYTGNVAQDEKYIKLIPGIQSELSLPMMEHNNSPCIGVINFLSTHPKRFNKILATKYAKGVEKTTEIFIQKKQYNALKAIVPPFNLFAQTEDVFYDGVVKSLERYFISSFVSVWIRTSFDSTSFYLSKATLPSFYEEYKKAYFLSADIKNEYIDKDLAQIIRVKEIKNTRSRIYQFCKHHQFKSYIILRIVIDYKYQAFINIFSKRIIEEDEITGYSKSFLDEIAKKIALATQSNRILNSFKIISQSLIKRETENPQQKIVEQAFQLLPSVDSVVLFPYEKGKIINIDDAVVGGNLPSVDLTNQKRPANLANYIIKHGNKWLDNEDKYQELSKAAVPERPERRTFWQAKKLQAVAGFRLDFEGDPVGVMFFNYKVKKDFDNDSDSVFIESFTNLAKIALINETYIQRIHIEREQLDKINFDLRKAQRLLEEQKAEIQFEHDQVYEKMINLLPVSNAASLVEIVRAVNHDIRNHLIKVSQNLLNIRKDSEHSSSSAKDREKLTSNIEIINKDVDNATLLINLFAPNSFKISVENLYDIANEVRELFTNKSMNRHKEEVIKITVSKLIEDIPEIRCSKAEISMIAYNLVSNALSAIIERWKKSGKTTSDPHGFIAIYINYDHSKKEYILIIKDNGVGISNENQKRVFDLGFTTKEESEGLGIGLYFVNETIRNIYQGSIICESYMNKGTTFELRFKQKS